MPTGTPQSPRLETAHVLAVDLVGFTLLSMDEQRTSLGQFLTLLRGTPEFRRAEAARELLCLPRGDGAALVFFRNPIAPVQCAMELAQALAAFPHIRVRMGVHSGPVYRVEDINAQADVSGGGINFAVRVMDCGDAGHILVSSTVAETLKQLGDWPSALDDLGECEVKHGVRLRLYNLHTPEVGNPRQPGELSRRLTAPTARAEPARRAASQEALPARDGPGAAAPSPSPPTAPAHAAPSAGEAFEEALRSAVRPGQVALLYKRDAQPDEELLRFLEAALAQAGYRVFIDRHLAIGVEWAREIDRQIRASYAVVPLLSERSIQSEMLAYELELAREAQSAQRGRPRILPVRVGYEGPLPQALAVVLDPLEYAVWNGPQDNQALLAALLQSLRAGAEPSAALLPRERVEPAGGAVRIGSEFYVRRPTDDEFCQAIARQDSIVLVKGARQMGKTSLLARGLQEARHSGARVVLTDFQKLNEAHLANPDAFYLTMAELLSDQLDLGVEPEETWQPRRGPNGNFDRFMRRYVLAEPSAPLVWGLDEVDRLFCCSFASEVFGLFRSWHNDRALDPTGPWSRLTLAIAYATEAHLFITDVNQSPFNVGTRLALGDFTFDQLADLNRRYGSPLRGDGEVARFYRMLGGQPYLSHRGIQEMVLHRSDLSSLESQMEHDEGIFGDHLRRMLVLLVKSPSLCEAVQQVLRGGPCPSQESFYRLRAAGILAGDSSRNARPRCQLYANYLEAHLL